MCGEHARGSSKSGSSGEHNSEGKGFSSSKSSGRHSDHRGHEGKDKVIGGSDPAVPMGVAKARTTRTAQMEVNKATHNDTSNSNSDSPRSNDSCSSDE